MFKAKITRRKNDVLMQLDYSDCWSELTGMKSEHVGKLFPDQETAENYLISCTCSFVNMAFEGLTNRLKAVAPYMMHSYRFGSADHRLEFIDHYWKVLELRELYFTTKTSPYQRSRLLIENTSLLISGLPKALELGYEELREVLRDLIKAALMLDRYFAPIIEEQRKEWYRLTDTEVDNEFKNVA